MGICISWILNLQLFFQPCLAQMSDTIEPALPQLNGLLNVRDFCIADNGNELFFTIQDVQQKISRIAFMKHGKAGWSEPQLMPFSSSFNDLEAFLAPDQKRLYFASNRPADGLMGLAKDYDIWYVHRTDDRSAWSDPIRLDTVVNSTYDEFFPCITHSGNLYITVDKPAGMGRDDIYHCRWNGTGYEPPIPLDTSINSAGFEFNAYVSRDEQYILFTRYQHPGGAGSGDLCFSTKRKDGRWNATKWLEHGINTPFMEYCPFIDELHGMLYFTSRRSKLSNESFAGWHALIDKISQGPNGCSKVYKMRFDFKRE